MFSSVGNKMSNLKMLFKKTDDIRGNFRFRLIRPSVPPPATAARRSLLLYLFTAALLAARFSAPRRLEGESSVIKASWFSRRAAAALNVSFSCRSDVLADDVDDDAFSLMSREDTSIKSVSFSAGTGDTDLIQRMLG
jgi:hypothetical protein